MPIDVVIDTNIIVAALRSSLGASYRPLQTLEGGKWRPLISPALALEYDRCSSGAPIVTFNTRDFRGSERFGIKAMSPGEFLASSRDER